MKLFQFFLAFIFSALAVNAFIYRRGDTQFSPSKDENALSTFLPKDIFEILFQSIGLSRESQESESGWNWENNGRKKVVSEYNVQSFVFGESNDDSAFFVKDKENEKPELIGDEVIVLDDITGENEGELTSSSLSNESEFDISSSEDDQSKDEDELQHKSLSNKKCKKGKCRQPNGKRPCKKGNRNCRRRPRKPCKRGRNRKGKCCKKGVKKNGKCKGFWHRIGHHLKNRTEEKLHEWIDRLGRHHSDYDNDNYDRDYTEEYNDGYYDDGDNTNFEEEEIDNEDNENDGEEDYDDMRPNPDVDNKRKL